MTNELFPETGLEGSLIKALQHNSIELRFQAR